MSAASPAAMPIEDREPWRDGRLTIAIRIRNRNRVKAARISTEALSPKIVSLAKSRTENNHE